MKKILTIFAVALLMFGANAEASITTFFGIDDNANGSFVSNGNAETARNDFLSNLTGVGTEDFETQTPGNTNSIALSFPGSNGSISGNMTGTDLEIEDNSSSGRFATSGSQYVEVATTNNATDFMIDFSDPIAAFGFYATDLGDFGNNDVEVTLTNGETTTFTIPVAGASNGNLLFWGFVATSTIDSISFANTGAATDIWGFDQLTVGDLSQVQAIPEPTAMMIWGLFGAAGIAGFRRRK